MCRRHLARAWLEEFGHLPEEWLEVSEPQGMIRSLFWKDLWQPTQGQIRRESWQEGLEGPARRPVQGLLLRGLGGAAPREQPWVRGGERALAAPSTRPSGPAPPATRGGVAPAQVGITPALGRGAAGANAGWCGTRHNPQQPRTSCTPSK